MVVKTSTLGLFSPTGTLSRHENYPSMITFRENISAKYWFEQQCLGDDDWSELYSLFEHMRDHVGLPWETIQSTLEEVASLMNSDKWHGKNNQTAS